MPQTRHRALQQGARDFLTKPLDQTEVLLRIDNLLKARFHHLLLEQKVGERTQELERAQIETLHRLALAGEYRDDTGMHTRHVAQIAQQMQLHIAHLELIQRAAPLHDVGKIGVADAILLKPSKLTDEEFATMKRHTVIGAQMLSGSSSLYLQLAEEIALTHHERWDGRGYADIAGESIPLSGRIVAVADVFDALTHERPYKIACPLDQAVKEIIAQSGKQFDSRRGCVRALNSCRFDLALLKLAQCANSITSNVIYLPRPVFSCNSSMRLDASALLSVSSNGSLACSDNVFKYDFCAPVIASSPVAQSSGFLTAFEFSSVLISS